MASTFTMRFRVRFSDTDMAGIMHFSNFFRYMEETEHAFLRSLGSSVHLVEDGRIYGWPRVHAACDYRHPLRFEDEVEVCLSVHEKRDKRLTYDFTFHKLGGEAPQQVAYGRMVVVCTTRATATGQMKAASIPASLANQITVAETPVPASRYRRAEGAEGSQE